MILRKKSYKKVVYPDNNRFVGMNISMEVYHSPMRNHITNYPPLSLQLHESLALHMPLSFVTNCANGLFLTMTSRFGNHTRLIKFTPY
jgi:hypothetical protein